jgi:hypothetical protein
VNAGFAAAGETRKRQGDRKGARAMAEGAQALRGISGAVAFIPAC